MLFLLLLILPEVRMHGSHNTPSSLNRHFKHHSFHAVKFVSPKPTKKGPVLFPNDAPPPPPTPLIVTSRPLSESIVKSDLNSNNSHTAQSQLNQVSFKPEYLNKVKNHRPFSYNLATVSPVYDFETPAGTYDFLKKTHGGRKDSYYTDYEKRLMRSIHQRKDTYKEENLWDRPIYRRRMNQESKRRRNARKTILSDKEKSIEIKVSHGSLYSREVDENDEDSVQVFRRMDYDEIKTKRRPFHQLDSRSDSHYRSRSNRPFKKMERVTYIKNRNRRPFQKRNRISDIEGRQVDRRPIQEVNSPREYYRNRYRRPLRYKESLTDIEDRRIKAILRKNQRTKSLSNDGGNRKTRPFKEAESLTDDSKKENGKPVYKTEDHKKKSYTGDNSEYNFKRLSNYDIISSEIRPTYKLEDQKSFIRTLKNISRDSKKKANKPSNRAGNINKSKDQTRELSEEKIQHREIRPLYAISDHYNDVKQTTHKPYRYKPQEKIPDYSNYFYSNEGLNDNSKGYNHGDNYAFSYTVKDHKTGDDFSHSQHSRGSATNGEYRVRLPDGRMQIVSYTADENGYKADVRYDAQHHHDNSIDGDANRENGHHKADTPIHFKNNYAADHFDSQDFSVNQDYEDHRYKNDRANEELSQPHRRPTVSRNQYQHDGNGHTNHYAYDRPKHTNDHADHLKDNIGFTYDLTAHKKGDHGVHKDGSLSDNNNDYLEHYKDKNVDKLRTQDTDYFLFSDEIRASKEIADYSSELNGGYRPHKSKFSTFDDNNNVKSTVTPSYDELKDIYVTSLARRQENGGIQVLSTANPNYDVTTERVVVIGAKNPKLYTNIRNGVSVTPSPLTYTTPFASTPSGYLFSTIANLKNQVNLGSKPVLSNRYIDKINKYLSY